VDQSRRVLARLLTAEGRRVHEASDGAEALQIWSAHPIDLVVTDQDMGGMTGAALSPAPRMRLHTPHLDALFAELQAAMGTCSPDEVAAASHRLGGLAEHFGLAGRGS
jgi:CheY-like chemotaxis protein